MSAAKLLDQICRLQRLVLLRWRFGADLTELNTTKPGRGRTECWLLLRLYSLNLGLSLAGHKVSLSLPWMCLSTSALTTLLSAAWFLQHIHAETRNAPSYSHTNTSHTHVLIHRPMYSHAHTLMCSNTLIRTLSPAHIHWYTLTSWYTDTHWYTHSHTLPSLPARPAGPWSDSLWAAQPLSWCPSSYRLSHSPPENHTPDSCPPTWL